MALSAVGARAGESVRQLHAAGVSSDVADVAKRPKNRPGSRERSSITTRWQGWLA